MTIPTLKRLALGAAMTISLTLLGGCSVPKEVAYFQDTDQTIQVAQANLIKARPGDKVMIIVKAKDSAVSAMFNLGSYAAKVDNTVQQQIQGQAVTQPMVPAASDGLASYTVDNKGDIDFPLLGQLHIGGMTRQEIAGFVKGELMGRDLVKDPQVTVEFLNAGVNVLGEVDNPGRIQLNTDALTLDKALAMSGDIKLTGRRDNVKVLRKENGVLKTYTIDMTSAKSMLQSPGYYLQQDDIIYVEPTDMQKRNTKVNGNNVMTAGFWISIASLLATAVTTIGVFVVK